MGRKGKQIQVRLRRVELANRLLEWLKRREEREGYNSHWGILLPFAKESGVEIYELWRAWDILKEAGRRVARPGSHWSISSFEPIEVNESGDILSV